MRRFATVISACASIMLVSATASTAFAKQINTADKNGAYHKTFCPPLRKALKRAQFKYNCSESEGSRDNIELVSTNASHIGFAQLDLYALEKTMQGGKKLLHTLRDDVARECLFLVSSNAELKSFGDVAANAEKLSFVLPPKKSGHVGTFHFLQQIDPKGLGRASQITYKNSTDEALDDVLGSGDKNLVTMFVQFPDPDNKRFKSITKKGGHFVPVIDRNILRQDIGGEKVYFAENTQISNPKWNKKSEHLITACTPMVLFTGDSKQITDDTARKDHEDLIKTIEALPVADLQPGKNFLSQLWNKTKSLSAKSVDALMQASDQAREAAKPMMNKAKDLSSQAIEASEPLLEKAKEVGGQVMEKAGELADKAKEETSDLLDKSQ